MWLPKKYSKLYLDLIFKFHYRNILIFEKGTIKEKAGFKWQHLCKGKVLICSKCEFVWHWSSEARCTHKFIMSSLSEDLNSYLKRGSNGSSNSLSSMTSKLSAFKLPTLKSPFGGSSASTPEDEEPFLGVSTDDGLSGRGESQGWLAKKMAGCLPSLTKKQRIIGFMSSLVLGNSYDLFNKMAVYITHLRSNLLWTCCFILTYVDHQPKKVFVALFFRKPFYYI